jgi:hypothetical protein
VASLAAFLRLMHGPMTLGSVTFDVNTLILSSAGLVAGVQAVLLGMLAKASAVQLGIVPPTRILTRLQGLRPVELGVVSGFSLLLVGVVYALWAVDRWRATGFGDLAAGDSVRIVVPAVTAAAIGLQLAFSGFALAILDFGRELRLKRAQP